MTTNYNEAKKVGYDSTERYSGSVLTFSNDKQNSSINPTQKPVEIFLLCPVVMIGLKVGCLL